MTSPVSSSMVSIYDGQRCCGWVFARCKQGFEAFTAAQQSLGIFARQREAATAIMRKAAAEIPEIEAER
jgi:hypothetical protein